MGRMKLKAPWSARSKKSSIPLPDYNDKDEGTFEQLYYRCPTLAERETRTLFVRNRDDGISPGEYAFTEAFCMGKKCDCRRVMFMVYRRNLDLKNDPEHVATIGFGWEPMSFYLEWMYGDREGAEFMRGPVIEPNSPLCGYDHHLLRLFRDTCLLSPDYVDRVRRHYAAYKRL